jgi:RNA polymerase sigma-70 factor (ECF subfamily)
MRTSPVLPAAGTQPGPVATEVAPPRVSLAEVYEGHFDFVWRSARRLGVHAPQLEDVVQEVFIVAHRRLAQFEGRASLKTWLFGITRHVVRDHFRSLRRKPVELLGQLEPADVHAADAETQVAAQQGARLLHALLAQLDSDKREVFILAELEQMSAPEIAQALDQNLNTVYARLRAARHLFDQALGRHLLRQRRTG